MSYGETRARNIASQLNLVANTDLFQVGNATLVSGTVTVDTTVTLTSSSIVLVQPTTIAGTAGTHFEVAITAGVPGTGEFTITAVDTAGSTVATDVSVVRWVIIN